MNTKKLTIALATTALVVSVPLAALYPGAAVAAPHHATEAPRANLCSGPATAQTNAAEQAARAGATSRLSGLAYGGAALEQPPTAPPTSAPAISGGERAARAAATARLSGLAFGGAL